MSDGFTHPRTVKVDEYVTIANNVHATYWLSTMDFCNNLTRSVRNVFQGYLTTHEHIVYHKVDSDFGVCSGDTTPSAQSFENRLSSQFSGIDPSYATTERISAITPCTLPSRRQSNSLKVEQVTAGMARVNITPAHEAKLIASRQAITNKVTWQTR